jgi:threonyl-tRNA synthetase
MAQAVMRLYGDVKFGIGPSIEDGFYYDIDLKEKISEEDLDKIAAEMKKIIKENQRFEKEVISKDQAKELFKDQPYKLELINELPDGEEISIFKNGDFMDLCRGPHINYTKQAKHFKLTKVAGAYWRGDEKNQMLTRIYGTIFPTKEELEDYLERVELAKQRDHRRLGKKLDLFSIQPDQAGSGLVFWHPKGAAVRRSIEDFWYKEHQKNGYQFVNIPHIAKSHLWQTSGHLDFYKENMYPMMALEDDNENYILKPMNCPEHILIYKNSLHSYREFPLRWAEMGTVYRYEKIGVLHGLMRVRGFTQDDAHIFCRKDQVDEEIKNALKFVIFILKTFGFEEFKVYLSTRPEKYVGDLDQWALAENALKNSLEAIGFDYEIDPGEGVFYGPKIDIKIKDSLKRLWQCSTIQVDFNIPDKFNLEFVNSSGEKEQPVMIHRALFGSLERFFGVLIEHYGGRFPLWLAPVQVQLIPIAERHIDYAYDLKEKLSMRGFRVEVNDKDEKLGKKIWGARDMQIPYMAVIGDKEMEEKKVSVRSLSEDNVGNFDIDGFTEFLLNQIDLKK